MDIDEIIHIASTTMRSVLDFIRASDDFATVTTIKRSDVTRKFDLIAEQTLERELLDRAVSARVISEEGGDRVIGNDPECTLIFDPIDGSTNTSIGFPYFCSSLAYAHKLEHVTLNDVVRGAIITNFQDVYATEKGKGASFNGEELEPRKAERYKPIVSVYSYGVPTVPIGLIELEKSCIVRTWGSIALDLCMVAAGTVDAVIDTRGLVSSYDIATAQLIVRECGALITDDKGEDLEAEVTASGMTLICTADSAFLARILDMLKLGTTPRS